MRTPSARSLQAICHLLGEAAGSLDKAIPLQGQQLGAVRLRLGGRRATPSDTVTDTSEQPLIPLDSPSPVRHLRRTRGQRRPWRAQRWP